MTSEEEAIYTSAAGGTGKQRKKTRKITHGLYFYGDLYSLAAKLYEMMDKNREKIFPLMPKTSSKTGAIHVIGQWLADRWIMYNSADIHNIRMEGAGLVRFIHSPDYVGRDQYFILTQSSAMEFLFTRYGVRGEQKQMTIDDKVGGAGILFCEDVRFYIQDMIGASRASKSRSVLDEAGARKLAGMNRLYANFIDPEVIVNLPDDWNSEENKMSVDEINGEGAFKQFGVFNPNNRARIVLLWSKSDIAGIFAKVLSKYNTAGKVYKGYGRRHRISCIVWGLGRSTSGATQTMEA